jgi:serine/threonine-protein kinase
MSDDDRTVFTAGGALPGTLPPGTPAAPAALPTPRNDGIKPGDLLNHMFEVRRFLARGGMGEVFEGVNVASDERVAIKVMLPALAEDPNVQTMFRREARTLTRLSHPALVQYRVLAQEPQLGVLYIVTEFIDGRNLSDVLGEVHADETALRALLKWLAGGLQAAHRLGAIHRDISPDNVLLENGDLAKARIIDFGIAKDLDPGSKTIIGDGFAGKLSYVAPEQLGDFTREVGPWTDVYSLALVILAVAGGRGVDLGGSFVDAVDKRRKGIPLDAAPEGLRPVLAAMLAPDPAERLRSMDEVLAALTPGAAPAARPADTPPPPAIPVTPPKASRAAKEPKSGGLPVPIPALAAGGAALLALAGAGAWFATRDAAPAPTGAASPATTTVAAAAPQGTPAERARAAVAAVLPTIPCSWLDIVATPADAATLRLAGVAGRPAEAQAAIARAAQGAGGTTGGADFSDVAPISASECGSVDAFRAIRATGPAHLSVPQRTFEMVRLAPPSNYAGQLGARTIINLDLAGLKDFAIYGLDPTGLISPLIPNRAAFDEAVKAKAIDALGGQRYRIAADANHAGWSGILLLTGDGGFSDALVAGPAGSHGADWGQRFATAARAHDWRSEMVWFKMVDERPN